MTDPRQPADRRRPLCGSRSATRSCSTASTSRSTEGTIFALLGPNGAGKTTMVRILSTLIPADSGTVRVAGHDVLDDPDGVRASIGVTGQFSAVDELLTGEENLRLMADLNHLGRVVGRARVDELLDRFGLADAAAPAGVDVLGRDAPPPRPGHDAGRLAAGDLPRRAHDRARPAQPPADVGRHPRARRRRRHDPPHHPVPRRGRRARRSDRRPRPRPHRRRRHPRRAEAADSRRPRPSPVRRPASPARSRRPVRRRRHPTRSDSSSACPATATSRRSAICSSSSTTRASRSSSSRSTAPTWTTSSSPSPVNRPLEAGGSADEHPHLHRQRFDDDAPPQPSAPAALPVDDTAPRRHADRLPAAVRLRPRRPAQPRPRQRGRRRTHRARRLPQLRHARNPAHDGRRRRPGHRDRRRDGHDRRDHRPLPHDGHRPLRGPHRPRARQPHPNPPQHRHRARRRRRTRLPPRPPACSTGSPRSAY